MCLAALVSVMLLAPAPGQSAAATALSQSVHAKLTCIDCHTAAAEVPQCRRCHFANYQKTLDSVHQRAVARGDRTAPLCVNCHGSHGVKKAAARAAVSQTCAACHEGVATAYARSVHGRALAQGNADVPVCTDCHYAHDVAGPRRAEWELRSVQRGGLVLDPEIARGALDGDASHDPTRGAVSADEYERLTDREKQVLKLVAEGRSNKEVAALLGISVKTAMSHREHVMEKLRAHNRTDLIRFALRHGVIRADL